MEQGFNQTSRANRVHIGIFGRRNAGKSSLINAITGQTVSVVSEIRGTTTDTVEKAMELFPIGPVVLVDTPGMDDAGALGNLRIQQTKRALSHTDLAILAVDAAVGMTAVEEEIAAQIQSKQVPFLLVWNKSDLLPAEKQIPEGAVLVSAKTGAGIPQLKQRLGELFQQQNHSLPNRSLFEAALLPEDIVILVTPIDESAPKGRMILPQVQAIRELLDKSAICLTVQPEQLPAALGVLNCSPRLVVTDSQAFGQVKEIVSETIPLTSFSILFARLKGVLQPAMEAVKQLEQLPEGSRILIAEGCTHHRQCNDIGTVKLPKWIQAHTGKQFQFSFSSGNSFPEDLSAFQLIVHCGGCMLNAKEMESRAAHAAAQHVPYTNYGLLIAYLNGIYTRSLQFLRELDG